MEKTHNNWLYESICQGSMRIWARNLHDHIFSSSAIRAFCLEPHLMWNVYLSRQVLHFLQDDEGESERICEPRAKWSKRKSQASSKRILSNARPSGLFWFSVHYKIFSLNCPNVTMVCELEAQTPYEKECYASFASFEVYLVQIKNVCSQAQP